MHPAGVSRHMAAGETPLNALIDAAVGIVLFVVPFSPAIGGGVAGYLHRGSTRDGAIVGAVAWLFMLVPLVLVVFLAAAFVPLPPGQPGLPVVAAIVGIVATVASYAVALAVLGGVAGRVLAAERDPEADEAAG